MASFSAELLYALRDDDFITDFYANTLGANVIPDSEEEGFRYVQFGESCLHFFGRDPEYNHHHFGDLDEGLLGRGVELSINLAADFPLETYAAALIRTLPARKITRPVQEHAGGKDFRIIDPNGYYLRFAKQISFECSDHEAAAIGVSESWNPFPVMQSNNMKELFWLPRTLTHPEN